jgi:hypothetical protein
MVVIGRWIDDQLDFLHTCDINFIFGLLAASDNALRGIPLQTSVAEERFRR